MYLGTAYAGSQIQKNGITIQEHLDKALKRLFAGAKVKTIFAGRTDSGVHALGQAVSVLVDRQIQPNKVLKALNSLLPLDIRVSEARYAKPEFNPRYDAARREYLYNIYYGRAPALYLQDKVWHIDARQKLNWRLMRRAARLLRGEHDCAAFCAAGSAVKNKVRRVTASEITARRIYRWPGAKNKADGLLLTYKIQADGFLYHMVRNIVAALVDVGLKKMTLRDLREIMRSGQRSKLRSATAPAAGLVLYDVKYGKEKL
ncbi:tRNA pseudouridine synthase A [Candidatus Termititenax aidoneus]|uniref:tRNA pseudouridine synthase A n=1 Tax=Termititenax aidoneus TaxID=2218524 RepID=A0A388TCW0_TERA1|nr:tRNA pseudouridine synthase A [Candidatus Termititenax aidoneus]